MNHLQISPGIRDYYEGGDEFVFRNKLNDGYRLNSFWKTEPHSTRGTDVLIPVDDRT